MANPHAHLTRRTVILAKLENTSPGAIVAGSTTTSIVYGAATFSATNSEVGKALTVGNESTLDTSTEVETRIVVSNTTTTLTLNEALSSAPDSGDYSVYEQYGNSGVTPDQTNAILTMAPSITINGEALSREVVRKSLSPVHDIIGNRNIDVSFDVELKGSGSAGTACEIDPLLQACGFKRVLSGSNLIYTPTDEPNESCVIYCYLDQMLYKIRGCVGNVTFKLEQGKYGVASFAMRGLYEDLIDGVAPNVTSYDTTLPPIVKSADFNLTISGQTAESSLSVATLEFDMANEVAELKNMTSTSAGPQRFFIAGRAPTGSFNPQQVLTNDLDFHTAWAASTALTTMDVTLGDTVTNKIKFDFGDDTRFNSIAPADDGGMRRFDIGFQMAAGINSTGEDEITITYIGA